MKNKDYNLKIILLAAGKSERFNGVKLLAKIQPQENSTTLIQHALQQISAALKLLGISENNLHIATGRYHLQLTSLLSEQYNFIHCHDAHLGLGHTIAQSVHHVTTKNKDTCHIMIALADQIALTTDDYVKLIKQSIALPSQLVCAKAKQEIMPPAIFPADYFNELIALQGDKGAKVILYSNQIDLKTVNLPHAERDIDTRQDLSNWHKDETVTFQ